MIGPGLAVGGAVVTGSGTVCSLVSEIVPLSPLLRLTVPEPEVGPNVIVSAVSAPAATNVTFEVLVDRIGEPTARPFAEILSAPRNPSGLPSVVVAKMKHPAVPDIKVYVPKKISVFWVDPEPPLDVGAAVGLGIGVGVPPAAYASFNHCESELETFAVYIPPETFPVEIIVV